jgi:hypothetical protein
MPTPMCGFAIATYQGKIYCIGGRAVGEIMWTTRGCGVTEVYDIATKVGAQKNLCHLMDIICRLMLWMKKFL